MPKTHIVIPVHNRREVTLRCLRQLASTGVLDWAQAVVVDDGSTDGTAEAIRREHPSVTILPGDGNLWWTGAMDVGMRAAMDADAQFLIWLNDDCLPEAGTLEGLIAEAQARQGITVAQARTPTGYLYGGTLRDGVKLKRTICAPGEVVPCQTFTGNCVAIPRFVVERIGYPDRRGLPHILADTDYGLRATAAGIPCWVVGEHSCHNEDNLKNHMLSWLLSGVPLARLWRDVFSVRSTLHLRTAWTFHTRHFGLARGAALFAWPYLRLSLISLVRLLLPRRWIERLYARHSAAWQTERFYEGRASEYLRSPKP